ncbi:MAG TPA: Ig-like domain-containing protein, partial [Candidatus Dormibacteraeota bacterium]|nr:Ig-like domain-containing protein [Candidatus Dormibacteraeota bacterium]
MVDPQNDTDLWTLQEYAAAHAGSESRWGTWWGRVSPEADLAAAQTASPAAVPAGSPVTYSVSVTNLGFTTATGARLVDILPVGAVFVSATATSGSCGHTNGVVVCSLGDLLPGASSSATIVAQLTQPGSTNTVTASGFGTDYAPANNTARVSTTVNPNAAPTMQAISNRTITEDSVLAPIDFTIGDAETPAANLVLTGASSDPAIVPNNNIIFGGSGSLRNVSVVPLPNANGSVTITRTVTDAEGGATSNSFVLTITAVNDPPTISDIPNQTGLEDQVLGPIPFTVGDVESAPAALSVSGASSNPALIPNANITFGGSGASRTISLRPATNQFGTATITVTVSDGSATTNDSFVVTVNRVNHLPTISDLPDRSINEDATLGPLSFTVGDLETSATALLTSGFCSNPALVPTNSFTFGGSGSNRTVTITPAPNQFGSGTITIAVTDSDGDSGIDTFLLTVNPVNDLPTVEAPTALTINEDAGLQTVTLTNITAGASNEIQAVTFSVISNNPQLIPNPTVNYTSPSTVGVLQFTTVTNASGVATLTLTANDGGASNNITT